MKRSMGPPPPLRLRTLALLLPLSRLALLPGLPPPAAPLATADASRICRSTSWRTLSGNACNTARSTSALSIPSKTLLFLFTGGRQEAADMLGELRPAAIVTVRLAESMGAALLAVAAATLLLEWCWLAVVVLARRLLSVPPLLLSPPAAPPPA